jgi:hypothetical protein
MTLFGAPLAHEDHAQRACHAAHCHSIPDGGIRKAMPSRGAFWQQTRFIARQRSLFMPFHKYL